MRFEKRTPELRLRLEGWRSRFVLGLAGAGFLLLAGRAFWLQGLDHDFLQAKGEARYGRIVDMPASRGPVKDRHGQPLAISTPVESIWVTPDEFEPTEAQLRSLAKSLGMTPAEIRQKVANKDRQFAWLKRQISPEQAAKVVALGIPGVFQQREYRRFYPAGEVMAHVVGFTGIDDSGQEGIELAQQPWLAGVPGSRKVIKDRKGRIVEDVESLKVPRDGKALVLSIDQRLQFLAHRELKAAIEQNKAKGGSLVMLDARTGEVLALVNQPDYNPNNRASVTGRQTRNRSVTDIFEPGSTMKPFTIAAALEDGIVTPDTIVQTAGPLVIGGWSINDAHPHGALSVAQVIQKSSNIGTARIQLQMPAARIDRFYRDLGLGAPPQTGFPGEAKGLLRPGSSWKPVEQATMAYGHGLSVSLLQLARAYTIFTGDGHLLPLSLLRRDALPIGKPLISRETAREVARMMEMAVGPGGTAPRAAVPGYRVAGKTGTAHKAEAGGYAEHKYVSSFAGFGPVSDPRYIVAVMIDEPGAGKHYGGDVAAPVFASVMGAALRMMSVPPDAPQALEVKAPARPAATEARVARGDRRVIAVSEAPLAPAAALADRLARLGVPLADLTTDSRQVKRGSVFLAYPGSRRDGRDFIADAVARGAAAVIWERRGFSWNERWDVPHLAIEGLREAASAIAGCVHGDPSAKLWMVGVTGTNGKTSVSQWVAQALDGLGRRAAVIGTLGNGLVGERAEARNTTPDAVVLQRELADYLRRGARAVAMEVSSHGLDQGRTAGVKFDVGVFTNLTRDHLDYHGTMEAYAEAKYRLFTSRGLAHAVVNLDDAFGRAFAARLRATPVSVTGYGLAQGELRAGPVMQSDAGLRFRVASPWGEGEIAAPVLGAFNAANLLAVVGVLVASGVAFPEALAAVSRLSPVPGRLERVGGGRGPLVVVDYAHTPDALEKALAALRPAVAAGHRLLCVFGCGGERDPGKRPIMGEAASRLADHVIVTSDNPRGEDPAAIAGQVLAGAGPGAEAIADRQVAIFTAVHQARAGDIVLVAGKGHETYQEIAGVRHPFSDREVALAALEAFPR